MTLMLVSRLERIEMSEIPEGLYYTKEHEWIRLDGEELVLGITDYAQNSLTDIVYVELPEVGQSCAVMDEIAIVESVKSASPIFAPLIGVVTAINEALEDTPELMNQDPYGEGWMVRMTINGSPNLPSLLGAAEYKVEIGE